MSAFEQVRWGRGELAASAAAVANNPTSRVAITADQLPRGLKRVGIVVNTCSFIAPAQKESIDTILEMAEHKKFGVARD